MAGLCTVVAVVLALSLSTANGLTDEEEQRVTVITNFMVSRYGINTLNNQVCLAVNVPNDQNLNNLAELFTPTTAVWVTQRDQVYIDNGRLVAAIPNRNAHAESRVLNNMNSLIGSANGHFLVFYSFYSPCYRTCTNLESTYTIIPRINNIIPNWGGRHAFVFSKVFGVSRGATIDQNESIQALQALANSRIGRNNIFRCYTQGNNFQCIRCFNGANLVQQCLVNLMATNRNVEQ